MKKVSTLRVFLVIDAIIILLLYFNADKYCDVPLSILPSSLGVHHVRKHFGYKSSLITEIVLLTASFLWMAVGTINISMSTTCQSTNPYVWWTVFVFVTFFWYGTQNVRTT
ncbi:hypothetical protein, conserved [Babesia bigemina]|uniref:Uncharacterized protein n=1 Tax=Babesia bigemina TaxID=5866 RepID=A0A061DCC1_BABBI|nr:hypothetical protein, conserved [Babesia bigemina]CDR97712.1 hypothetical protein, conserved [Babesia bigemina]|eukprot:XP_012769898.1 hypothetical protein, conserved [Babesia bigemina]